MGRRLHLEKFQKGVMYQKKRAAREHCGDCIRVLQRNRTVRGVCVCDRDIGLLTHIAVGLVNLKFPAGKKLQQTFCVAVLKQNCFFFSFLIYLFILIGG